jgi:hypothetical protein
MSNIQEIDNNSVILEIEEPDTKNQNEELVENNYFYKFLCLFNPNTLTNKELFGSDEPVHPLCVCITKVFVILLRLVHVGVILLCITFTFYIIYLSITGKKMK